MADYDVCLSFAGEDRAYVRQVASSLRDKGIRVFFDEYKIVELWGKDLYDHLDYVYKSAARFCIIFASIHYSKKLWTNHERRSAQERALNENLEYILPVRFDNTAIPGLRETIGYIDLSKMSPLEFSEIVVSKIGKPQMRNYLPPIPDKLYKEIGAKNKSLKDAVLQTALQFLDVLKRMTDVEKCVVFNFFIHGCPGELPDNVHIHIDLLRRVLDMNPAKMKRILEGLFSLGFKFSLQERACDGHSGRLYFLEWHDMSAERFGNATLIAKHMIVGALQNLCEDCGFAALMRLDFSQLSSATALNENHKISNSWPEGDSIGVGKLQ